MGTPLNEPLPTSSRGIFGAHRFITAIAEAQLPGKDARLKVVLYAFCRWADWNSGEGRPSIDSIAEAAGLKSTATGEHLLRAHDLGLLVKTGRFRRRVPVRRLCVEKLESMAKRSASHPESGVGPPAKREASNPDSGYKQTIHPSNQNKQMRSNHGDIASPSTVMDGCENQRTDSVEGRTALLAKYGVRGPNLRKLAEAPGITQSVIAGEWQSVLKDRSVRDPTAVLVRELAKIAGITLGREKPLSKDGADLLKTIERKNRDRPTDPVYQVSDCFSN